MELINRVRVPIKDKSKVHAHRNVRPDKFTQEYFKNFKLDFNSLNEYPDITKLENKLAEIHNCSPKNILITNGVDGGIKSVFESLEHKTVSFLYPNYAMYEVYSKVYGSTIYRAIPNEKLLYTPESLNDCVEKSKVLFIPNPSAPVESVLFYDEMIELVTKAKFHGTYVFIDEVYYGFGAPTYDRLPFIFDNVLVARSFSKTFGLPSLRVGYVIGSEKTIEILSNKRNAYEISTPSMEIALWTLGNQDNFIRYNHEIVKTRTWLKTKLKKMDIETHGSYSNNILIKVNSPKEVYQKLYDFGFIVRADIPAPAENYICVTIASQKVMLNFLKAFERCI